MDGRQIAKNVLTAVAGRMGGFVMKRINNRSLRLIALAMSDIVNGIVSKLVSVMVPKA